jgi:tetratricopeptide (TPR) repeat protein
MEGDNRMIARFLLAALAALPVLAYSADTPEPVRVVRTPSVGERMDAARKAIATQDWNRAMTELNAAARDDPRNADVHNLLGYTYRKRAPPDLPKAIEHYNIALRIDPRHRYAHEYLGEAYLMDRKPQEAEKHLAELEKICGNKSCEEYADLAKSIAAYKKKN